MNKAKFANYLEKIHHNQFINIALFLKTAEHLSITETQLLKIFSWKKVKALQYSVSIINKEAFNTLIHKYPVQTISNRIEASLSGNSHSKRVSGSLLSLLAHQQSFPQIIIFSNNADYETAGQLHHNLLIIENLENFLAIIKRPNDLQLWMDEKWDCDIVYAQGNAISNQLHQKFFSQYDKIRCLLDIDLGGLKIFNNIARLIPTSQCEFVLSQYYLTKYQQYGQPLNHQQRLELKQWQYPVALKNIIHTMLKNNLFAEQEILICR